MFVINDNYNYYLCNIKCLIFFFFNYSFFIYLNIFIKEIYTYGKKKNFEFFLLMLSTQDPWRSWPVKEDRILRDIPLGANGPQGKDGIREPLGIFLALFREHLADTHRDCMCDGFDAPLSVHMFRRYRAWRASCVTYASRGFPRGLHGHKCTHYCTNCHSQPAEKRQPFRLIAPTKLDLIKLA